MKIDIQPSLASLKSSMVLPFWCQLTQAVLEKSLTCNFTAWH